MILLLCMQPWFSIDKCDSKPIKKGWKCHILRNFSVGLNFLDYEFKKLTFRPFLLVLNHICQSRIKVACKVAKSFLTLFPVTLVKVEVQESSLHQMNCKKVYFLTCLMQNVQKLNMVGCRALNDRANHYGPPCMCKNRSKEMLKDKKIRNSKWDQIFMTLLKNAKNGQSGHNSIESTLLSQSLTI